jgi:hypothetical protein
MPSTPGSFSNSYAAALNHEDKTTKFSPGKPVFVFFVTS